MYKPKKLRPIQPQPGDEYFVNYLYRIEKMLCIAEVTNSEYYLHSNSGEASAPVAWIFQTNTKSKLKVKVGMKQQRRIETRINSDPEFVTIRPLQICCRVRRDKSSHSGFAAFSWLRRRLRQLRLRLLP